MFNKEVTSHDFCPPKLPSETRGSVFESYPLSVLLPLLYTLIPTMFAMLPI